jgi:HTH-type transcriptional repressor of NAD biosynthesis genes
MSSTHGLVIGKFLPPHLGHQSLIDRAVRECARVTVIICGRPADPIPGPRRQAWLQELYPQSQTLLIDDHYDPDDSQVWAENVVCWLGQPPDVVFTSEDYGERFANHLGCRHISVDRTRTLVPCSGTAIRNDPFTNWEFLSPPVRSWYARRVCVVGAESTGTTTLAHALADLYGTNWVPEFGREYSELKLTRGDLQWRSDEFLQIAREQNRREEAASRQANRLLICDTNSCATFLWHRRYLGFDSDELRAVGDAQRCDLYILTGDDIPFIQDGTRDGEHVRHDMHLWFQTELQGQSVPWLEVRGPHSERLRAADIAIQRLFADSQWSPGS